MTIIEKYFSWNDFLKYVDWQNNDSTERSHDTYGTAWFGTPTFCDALNLAHYGWTEFLHMVEQTDIDCWNTLNNIQLWETKYSVAGSSIDMGRYIIGMPENMFHQQNVFYEKFHTCPKFVNIVVNISYCWERDFTYVFERGINVLNAINTLETNNIKTRIVLMDCCDNSPHASNDLYRIFITIKEYQDMFYLEKLMFPIAHPSFLRRLTFSAKERESQEIRELFGFIRNQGYGTPSNCFEFDDKNTLYFGTEPMSEEEIQKWVKQVINGHEQDYNGNSKFDEHLQDLKQKMAASKNSDDLNEYAQKQSEIYKDLLKNMEQLQQKTAGQQTKINNGSNEQQSRQNGNSGQQSSKSCDANNDKNSQRDNKSEHKSQNRANGKYLPVLKPSHLPVLKSSYLPVLKPSYLPVLVSFYNQHQITR